MKALWKLYGVRCSGQTHLTPKQRSALQSYGKWVPAAAFHTASAAAYDVAFLPRP